MRIFMTDNDKYENEHFGKIDFVCVARSGLFFVHEFCYFFFVQYNCACFD